MSERHVVVTTDRRGVFFGALRSEDGDRVELAEAQMCVYWSADVRGVLGLASHGPTSGCRVTRTGVPAIRLSGVTAVIECSAEAVEAWRGAPWS